MPRPAARPATRLAALLLAAGSALAAGLAGVPATSAATARPAVVQTKVIGHSVKGRAITAYRVGDPTATKKVVVMSTIHGDETAIRAVVTSLRDGAPVHGIDLWLVPVANPDGVARGTRKNAHGVDLNRNFPYQWADLDGRYESGPGAASEPETRALMAFFDQVRPVRVVSLHQPLHGVDVSTRRSRPFADHLAAGLDLPRKNLTCGGVCHGTFTQWYMHRYGGMAVTVEYGTSPTSYRMSVSAPRQLLKVLGGTR